MSEWEQVYTDNSELWGVCRWSPELGVLGWQRGNGPWPVAGTFAYMDFESHSDGSFASVS